MAPGFTLKSLSPSRPSVPLAIPSFPSSTSLSPLSSPGRSPISAQSPSNHGYFSHQGPKASREEAFKVVKHLEEVLSAWNEYRVALSHAGKAGRKLAGALKELGGCMDKTSVSAQTIKPSAAMIESTSEVIGKLSKKVDSAYDSANTDASKYFNLLAKESRSHDAYLQAVSKKHEKADKAYRKASKSLGDNSSAHSGLIALRSTLAEDIARANADQDALLGSRQLGMLLRLSSLVGGLAGNITSFFSEGLRKTGSNYPDVEYFRVLADLQWQTALPADLDDTAEEKKRDEIRLIKTRVALGEMDVVGEKAWETLSRDAPPTPTSASKANHNSGAQSTQKNTTTSSRPSDPSSKVHESPSPVKDVSGVETVNERGLDALPIVEMRSIVPKSDDHTRRTAQRQASSNQTSPVASDERGSGQTRHTIEPSSTTVSSGTSSVTLPSSHSGGHRSSNMSSHSMPQDSLTSSRGVLPHRITDPIGLRSPESPSHSRPPQGPRHVSSSVLPSHMGHAPRRSVSQIAREMERNAVNERQSAFEMHQGHASFVTGCSLCAMDYDRMTHLRQTQQRRVTMPTAYSQPGQSVTHADEARYRYHDEERAYINGNSVRAGQSHESANVFSARREGGLSDARRISDHPAGALRAPAPRRPTGMSPDFDLERGPL